MREPAYALVNRDGRQAVFRDDASHMTVRVEFGASIGDRARLQVRCVFAHATHAPYASAEALRCAAVAYDYLGDLAMSGDNPPDLEINTYQAGLGEVTFTGVDAVIGPAGFLGDAYGEVAPW